MTHKQTIIKMLLSNNLLTDVTFRKAVKNNKAQLRSRISELKKEGLKVKSEWLISPKKNRVKSYELVKLSKTLINKYL